MGISRIVVIAELMEEELGAQKIEAFRSIINNAKYNGLEGLPALVESMGIDNAMALFKTFEGHVEKEDNLRNRLSQ